MTTTTKNSVSPPSELPPLTLFEIVENVLSRHANRRLASQRQVALELRRRKMREGLLAIEQKRRLAAVRS